MKLVNLVKVTKIYDRNSHKVVAIDDISFSIQAGDFISIVGPSGSGKTTLLSIIGCLLKPTTGTVEIDGQSVSKLSFTKLAEIRSNKVGFVFQGMQLISTLNAVENIILPGLLSKRSSRKPFKHLVSKAKALLDNFDLSHRANHLPFQLSIGECRRVAIARALINEPLLILADEPTAGLDSQRAAAIVGKLRELSRNSSRAVVMVTHNSWVANQADKQFVLIKGELSDELSNLSLSQA